MAPSSADVDSSHTQDLPHHTKDTKAEHATSAYSIPLKYSGSLDNYESFDVTSVIGREFPKLQLSGILSDDAKVRDLAITVSQRGVVFFRRQDLTTPDLKILAQKLGELSGKPKESGLYRHPLSNHKGNFPIDTYGKEDDEISLISSEQRRILDIYKSKFGHQRVLASGGWHSDFTFEHYPTDYGVFKVVEAPEDVGGDTLWASGYEAYDRISPSFRKYLDTLTATYTNVGFHKQAKDGGFQLVQGPRGHPDNVVDDDATSYEAVHPLVRTNPVTGWKSLFSNIQSGKINGITERENEIFRAYFNQLFTENHDLQVRNRWDKDDIAIWDDRVVLHTATNDYAGKRTAYRVSSVGEKPFHDPSSVSRREALGQI